MAKAEPWRYEKYTWPEINAQIALNKVVVVPIGAIEQHGPALPLDVDMLEVTAVAQAAARLIPDDVLVLPTQCNGYTAHVMDFPGTINIHHEHLINFMIDIGKSLAYHGFKKIVYLNGHGSNSPNMDLVARRVNLETDAEAMAANWWHFISVDPEFAKKWRESIYPGGCAHACELETSLYLHIDEDNVRKDKIENGYYKFHEKKSKYRWVDLWGAGPGTPVTWTSASIDSGTMGEARLGTKEKGKMILAEAASQLAGMLKEFRHWERPLRGDHHAVAPTIPMPWGQTGSKPDKLGDVHDPYSRAGDAGKKPQVKKTGKGKKK